MPDLSPREKALVEAVKAVSCFRKLPKLGHHAAIDMAQVWEIYEALRAYDPPKPKVPQIPAWNSLSLEQQDMVCRERHTTGAAVYDLIRTLTSKEAE